MEIWREDYIPYLEDGETVDITKPQSLNLCIKLKTIEEVQQFLNLIGDSDNPILFDLKEKVEQRKALK